MRFNDHSAIKDKHAYLSPSKYHWINYDDEKFERTYKSSLAAQRGSELHALAAECIRLGVKLPKTNRTLNMFVNDAIGYRMTPEQPLYYSPNCFGTADAIAFRDNLLRIHDLKTGTTKASEHQLEIYAAIFCLEYDMRPHQIQMELRLYQEDEIPIFIPDPDDIVHLMDRIVVLDKRITEMKQELL